MALEVAAAAASTPASGHDQRLQLLESAQESIEVVPPQVIVGIFSVAGAFIVPFVCECNL